jgi:hypothetical protein
MLHRVGYNRHPFARTVVGRSRESPVVAVVPPATFGGPAANARLNDADVSAERGCGINPLAPIAFARMTT